MISGLWGKKVGMTQSFSASQVIPVTVISASNWFVTDIKTSDRDGYNALQLGCRKQRYVNENFSSDWLKKKSHYFSNLHEVRLEKQAEGVSVGQPIEVDKIMAVGQKIDVIGKSKGSGFTGVVKRYGFGGGRASHGDVTGRRPGAIGSFRSRGKVMKNKRLPGRKGCEQKTVSCLEVVSVEPQHNLILVKGSVPGKSGSLIFIKKRGQHGASK